MKKSLIALVLCAGVAWFYFTPFRAVDQLQAAAERGDSDALNEMVDFDALRGSVKSEIQGAVAEGISKDAGNPFSAIGSAVTGVIVEPVVGNGGFIPPSPEFLPALRRLAPGRSGPHRVRPEGPPHVHPLHGGRRAILRLPDSQVLLGVMEGHLHGLSAWTGLGRRPQGAYSQESFARGATFNDCRTSLHLGR